MSDGQRIAGLNLFCTGVGRVEPTPNGARLWLGGAADKQYSDSQLDDFHGRKRGDYRWRPPATMTLRARFSHPAALLNGTAGFGWWNNPFATERALLPAAAPRALWFFFASAPANLALTGAWSGRGWFAQCLNVPSLLHLGGAGAALLLKRRLAQRVAAGLTRASERPLAALDITEWHSYRLEWTVQTASFFVDERCVMRAPAPPAGPLAAVLWMDNQWADVRGRSGLLATSPDQWLELEDIQLWHGYSS